MRAGAAALLLAWALPAAATLYVPRAEVEATAAAAAKAVPLPAEAAALAAALAQARLQALAEPLSGEATLLALLLAARAVEQPDATLHAQVAALQTHAPLTFTDPLDPELRGRPVPAFPVDGAARALRQRWSRQQARADYAAALAAGDRARLSRVAEPAALAELIHGAPESQRPLLRALAPAADARVQHALFRRLGEPELALALLRRPAENEGLRLIAEIHAVLAPEAATAVLAAADLAPGYVSAARLALGALVDRHPPARAQLLATLGDRWGDASARALAQSRDAATVTALRARLDDGAAVQRHALLALRWNAGPDAQAALARFAADPASPAALRAAVQAWAR